MPRTVGLIALALLLSAKPAAAMMGGMLAINPLLRPSGPVAREPGL